MPASSVGMKNGKKREENGKKREENGKKRGMVTYSGHFFVLPYSKAKKHYLKYYCKSNNNIKLIS